MRYLWHHLKICQTCRLSSTTPAPEVLSQNLLLTRCIYSLKFGSHLFETFITLAILLPQFQAEIANNQCPNFLDVVTNLLAFPISFSPRRSEASNEGDVPAKSCCSTHLPHPSAWPLSYSEVYIWKFPLGEEQEVTFIPLKHFCIKSQRPPLPPKADPPPQKISDF